MEITSDDDIFRMSVTVFIAFLISVSVLVNIAVIAGSILGEDNFYARLFTVNTQITALLIAFILLPLTIINGNNLILDPVSCLFVSSIQLLILLLSDISLMGSVMFWCKELQKPGFCSQNRKWAYITIILGWVLPFTFVFLSTGIIFHANYVSANNWPYMEGFVNLTATGNMTVCDWSVFPNWFPSVCVYVVFIPSSVFSFCLYLKVLTIAREKIRVTQIQLRAVNENTANGNQNVGRKARKSPLYIIVLFNTLLILFPHAIVNVAMLYNDNRWMSAVILHTLWSSACGVGSIIQSISLLLMSVNIKKGLRKILAKYFKCPFIIYPENIGQ